MKQHFNRLIEDFDGMAAIIGCSAWHSFCPDKYLHEPDEYYSIDKDKNQHPDLVMDITEPLPEDLKNRFKLVYLEYLDFDAYNDDVLKINDNICISKRGSKGFDTLLKMTSRDGFIVIEGCPREIEFRQQIYYRHLKYVELDKDGKSILIPKDQSLSSKSLLLSLQTLSRTQLSRYNR